MNTTKTANEILRDREIEIREIIAELKNPNKLVIAKSLTCGEIRYFKVSDVLSDGSVKLEPYDAYGASGVTNINYLRINGNVIEVNLHNVGINYNLTDIRVRLSSFIDTYENGYDCSYLNASMEELPGLKSILKDLCVIEEEEIRERNFGKRDGRAW